MSEGKVAVLHASFKSLARHQKWRVFVSEARVHGEAIASAPPDYGFTTDLTSIETRNAHDQPIGPQRTPQSRRQDEVARA
jgi:hypothetical protein